MVRLRVEFDSAGTMCPGMRQFITKAGVSAEVNRSVTLITVDDLPRGQETVIVLSTDETFLGVQRLNEAEGVGLDIPRVGAPCKVGDVR